MLGHRVSRFVSTWEALNPVDNTRLESFMTSQLHAVILVETGDFHASELEHAFPQALTMGQASWLDASGPKIPPILQW